MITLRTSESLSLDLDDAYTKIEKLERLLKIVVTTAQNRKDRMRELQKENDELRNRRD